MILKLISIKQHILALCLLLGTSLLSCFNNLPQTFHLESLDGNNGTLITEGGTKTDLGLWSLA